MAFLLPVRRKEGSRFRRQMTDRCQLCDARENNCCMEKVGFAGRHECRQRSHGDGAEQAIDRVIGLGHRTLFWAREFRL
jgi:hypothetical protein